MRFGEVEPPRTHSNFRCRPASPFVIVLRGGFGWIFLAKVTLLDNLDHSPLQIAYDRGHRDVVEMLKSRAILNDFRYRYIHPPVTSSYAMHSAQVTVSSAACYQALYHHP